jgi:hypothetical protein
VELGAKDSLNRFDCCLVDDGHGSYQIKFILKKNVPEAIGVPHASKELNEEEDYRDEVNESVDNSFTRQTLWRERLRGISFSNQIECDAIVR